MMSQRPQTLPQALELESEIPWACHSLDTAHDVELQVSAALLSQPGWNFSRLVVHRIPDGICLEGVLEAETDCRAEVGSLARRVARVDQVLNQILVHTVSAPHAPR